jgi:hypothetical protein
VLAGIVAVGTLTAALAFGDEIPGGAITSVRNVSPTETDIGVIDLGSYGAPSPSWHLDYGLSSSQWCMSGGSMGQPDFSGPVHPGQPGAQNATVPLTGLTPDALYCAAIFPASGIGGYSTVQFRAGVPNITQGLATAVDASTERLTATIDPVGSATSYFFTIGLMSPRGACQEQATPGTPDATPSMPLSSSTQPVTVGGDIAGLIPGGSYCWAVSAQNATGVNLASQGSFSGGDIKVETLPARRVTARTATLVGQVAFPKRHAGYPARFYYDISGSRLCRTNGVDISSARATAISHLASGKKKDEPFSAKITGLRKRTTYCYEALMTTSVDATKHNIAGELNAFTT